MIFEFYRGPLLALSWIWDYFHKHTGVTNLPQTVLITIKLHNALQQNNAWHNNKPLDEKSLQNFVAMKKIALLYWLKLAFTSKSVKRGKIVLYSKYCILCIISFICVCSNSCVTYSIYYPLFYWIIIIIRLIQVTS